MERGRTVASREQPLSRAEIKDLTALTIKKYRSERSCTIAEGEQLVVEALTSPWTVLEVVATPEFLKNPGMNVVFEAMKKLGTALRTIPSEVMKKLSELTTSPGVFALVSPPLLHEQPLTNGIALALDRVADPVNLGSIARTACFYGVERFILSEECADRLHPRALRASMGGLFHLQTETPKRLLERLQQLKRSKATIIVADANNGVRDLPDMQSKQTVLVLGSEAHGIREEILDIADVHWQLQPRGRDLTLNVAAAAAVLLDRITPVRTISARTKDNK